MLSHAIKQPLSTVLKLAFSLKINKKSKKISPLALAWESIFMGTLKHGVFSIGFHPLSRVQKFAKKNPRGTLRKLIKPFREACRTAHHVYMGAVRARARARARAR